MNIPEGLYYTSDHEWLQLDASGIATVGITDFAQSELGDIVFVEIETVGKTLAEQEIFGTVEAVKTVSDLFLPLKAEIIEKNTALDSNPELINTDPYGDGWMVKIKLENAAEIEKLLDATAYRKEIGI
jgi:glycine cleavage system H protein